MSLQLLAGLLLFTSCSKEPLKETPDDPGVVSGDPEIRIETFLTGYEIIWGMDFLPDGSLIFGEKGGKLYRESNGTVTRINGFPAVRSLGQGGLLDIRVHPSYSTNGWIYASYSADDPSGGGQLRLVRFRLTDNQVTSLENLFSTTGSNTWNGHFGSRIVFDDSGFLYLSIGEGGPGSYGGPNTVNNNAQDLSSPWGKIHRFNDDGSIPAGNPVFSGNEGPGTVFSYGHRNPQGLIIHPVTGALWESEHGPRGGDEINIINSKANYGWPVYSLGVNYDGSPVSSGHEAAGITGPLYTWTPSIGICGIAFITSDRFKSWKGNLLVSGLASQKLYRCVVDNDRITKESELLSGYGRVRNVKQAPDGSIYVSVENPGRIIRIIPQ